MKILLASSEVYPYSKTGGLADMSGALAKYLALAGHQVGVITPLYSGINEKWTGLFPEEFRITLPLGAKFFQAKLWTLNVSEKLTIYFIDQPAFYQRPGLYQENGTDYPDNAERFIFFSKCVAHLARNLNWEPEILHVHDWQAGAVPVLVFHQRRAEGWNRSPRTCFTIHNLAYQGNFPGTHYGLLNLPLDYFHPRGAEFFGGLSCLKAGIVFSDLITTVSPRYAREIGTEAFGHGLDGVLRDRQNSLIGILNGVDYEEWNTARNPFLNHPFTVEKLEGKTAEKLDLQQELGLPRHAQVPLFGTITRLVEQKGIDIALTTLEEMLATDIQVVMLGSGRADYAAAFKRLAERHPKKVAIRIGFDQALSHRIEAACDFYLMPSKFEPCGLNQMYSLRYATIPIVRATGGLDDSVVDITENVEKANGIKFHEYSSSALSHAIRKALAIYENPELLQHYRRNAVRADFSWTRTAQEYLYIFQKLLR